MLIWIIKDRNYAAKLDCFCSYASVLCSSCPCHGSHNRLKGPFILQEVDKVSPLSLASRVAWKWDLDAWASVFFPCLREPSGARQADQVLARADPSHQQVVTKAGMSHHHPGLYGRRDRLTLGGGCWLKFSSSRQCCSLCRQERYSSLRSSNSERSSLHWGENITKVITIPCD